MATTAKNPKTDARTQLKELIEDLTDEDVDLLLPLVEHIAGLQETVDILSDPDALEMIKASRKEFAKGGGVALNKV